MATGAPLPVREFSDVAEMMRHAAEVKARLFAPRPPKVKSSPPPVQAQIKVPQTLWRMPVVAERPSVVTVAQMSSDVLSVADVLRLVASVTGITRAQLLSEQKSFEVARARHIACWLSARYCGVTLNQVGRRIGGRDHTTILYGQRRVTAVIAALGLDMLGGPQRQAGILWRAAWPRVNFGRDARR